LKWARDKMRIGTDQNGDNLWINRAYLRTSDYCSVTVRVKARVRGRIRVGIGIRVR